MLDAFAFFLRASEAEALGEEALREEALGVEAFGVEAFGVTTSEEGRRSTLPTATALETKPLSFGWAPSSLFLSVLAFFCGFQIAKVNPEPLFFSALDLPFGGEVDEDEDGDAGMGSAGMGGVRFQIYLACNIPYKYSSGISFQG